MSIHAAEPGELVRTTVDLPANLLKHAEQAVRRGAARSRNALIARALEAYLQELTEQEIDAEFALMADDPRYQAEMAQIAEEFAHADWEALQVAEGLGGSAAASGAADRGEGGNEP